MRAIVERGRLTVAGVTYHAPQLAALEGVQVVLSGGIYERTAYPPNGAPFAVAADLATLIEATATLREQWNRELGRARRRISYSGPARR